MYTSGHVTHLGTSRGRGHHNRCIAVTLAKLLSDTAFATPAASHVCLAAFEHMHAWLRTRKRTPEAVPFLLSMTGGHAHLSYPDVRAALHPP